MFIDYLALLLINLTAGLLLLAYYVYDGIERPVPDQAGPGKTAANQPIAARNLFGRPASASWAAAFAAVGLVGFVVGVHLVTTWPLPGAFNVAFGEPNLLFSTLFLGLALAVAFNWSLVPLSLYAFIAGITAIVVGIRIETLGLTNTPALSSAGYILTGLAGVLSLPVLAWLNGKTYRLILALILIVAALIWAFIGYDAFWVHLVEFAKWAPK
ncbi:MAG TPA: DUF981 domain-containing protein [Candidatus Aquicultor sp.]|jgi:putative membrane protein